LEYGVQEIEIELDTSDFVLYRTTQKLYDTLVRRLAWKLIQRKYMLMSRYKKAGQMHSIKIANRSFEEVAKFKYLGTIITDQNCKHEEIKNTLNSENACYHSVQSLLSSRLLSRYVKVKIYKTIILPVVLYGCDTWSLTLREGHRLRVFENRVLRRICGPQSDEVTERRNFQVLTAASMMFRIIFWDVGRQSFYTAVHPRRQF
jgi:hypothetical protein